MGRVGAAIWSSSLATLLAVVASAAAADPPSLPADCTQASLTVTCTYTSTGAEQQFFAPPGVTTLHVDAIGGAGGGQHISSAKGGQAAEVTGDVLLAAHSSQQILYVEVAGAGAPGAGVPGGTLGRFDSYKGAGGFNGGGTGGGGPSTGGGGGGGASDVRTCSRSDVSCTLTGDSATDPRLLVASGGGGTNPNYNGGDASGGDGKPDNDPSCDVADPDPAAHCTDKGRGGTASAGGAGGFSAGSGGAGQGGNGANVRGFSTSGGGGGGGGWFGGGGGGALQGAGQPPGSDHVNQGSASGGGGSDLVPFGGSHALTTSAATVVITYDVVDSTGPTITITAPGDGATYDQGQVVDADYSCSDDGLAASGVKTCDGPVPSGSPIDTSTLGDHAFTVSATDNAGNASSETVHYTVADQTAPAIDITTPADGASYGQGEAVQADYSCTDGSGSGVASCDGPVTSGGQLDTGTAGDHAFTVMTTDQAGNAATRTVHYTVPAPSAPPPVDAPGTPPAGTPSGPAEAAASRIVISHRRVPLAGGRVHIALRCVGKATRCRGTLNLKPTHDSSRLRESAAGGARFDIAAGKSRTIVVKPTAKLLRMLRRSGKVIVLVTARPSARTASAAAAERLVTIVLKSRR